MRVEFGEDVEVIPCADKAEAERHMASRGYRFDRHEPWAFTEGFDFYNGPEQHQRGCVRTFAGQWRATFYER